MSRQKDQVAQLLAAAEYPPLREEAEFQEAQAALDSSPELRAAFAEAEAFFARHPVLTRIEGLPADSRARIAAALRVAMEAAPARAPVPLRPWGVRRQFAWAAALALLLAGMSMLSSTIIRQQQIQQRTTARHGMPPQDAFRDYVAQLMQQERMPLQQRDPDANRLISWLQEQGAPEVRPPKPLGDTPAMGCGYLQAPGGFVALICYKTDNGMVHLFAAPVKVLGMRPGEAPEHYLLQKRHTLQWSDSEQGFLLIAHEPEQPLPEIFL